MSKAAIEEFLNSNDQPASDKSPEIENFGSDKQPRRFQFAAYLFNQDGYKWRIRGGMIKELILEDDILDWYHKGHLIFEDPHDALERGESQVDTTRGVKVGGYKYRADARDWLYIKWAPDLDSGAEPEKGKGSDIATALFSMKFLFSVYATEDIPHPDGNDSKLQKLYFHDYRYQALRERNVFYNNTGTDWPRGPKKMSQQSNTNRELPTGFIIQNILNRALPGEKQAYSWDWETGGGNMFYTSPTDYKAIDDLEYVLGRHVSSAETGYQPCIFKLERFTDKWSLLPVGEYFKRAITTGNDGTQIAGPAQGERFHITTGGTDTGIKPTSKTPVLPNNNPSINYHFLDSGTIRDYNFTELSGLDCQELLTSILVHKYNKKTKTFHIDITDNNIENTKTYFQKEFIDKTLGGKDGHGTTSWLIDPSRKDNQNYRVATAGCDSPSALTVGRNKILLSALLIGNTIEFRVPGETNRKAGKFIAIDRSENYKDNDHDRKVLGQYFVTKVIHLYKQDTGYDNIVYGVKPYFYNDLGFDETKDAFYKEDEVLR